MERNTEESKSLFSSFSFFLSLSILLSSSHRAAMSLPATLRKLATPTNVTTAVGWGGCALTGALFLVQVSAFFLLRLGLSGCCRRPPPLALAPLFFLNLDLDLFSLSFSETETQTKQQPFDFIKRTFSGSSEEDK